MASLSKPLSESVRAELRRLGARETNIEPPDTIVLLGKPTPLPLAIGQLICGFAVPSDLSVQTSARTLDVTFSVDELGLSEYDCHARRPYLEIATTSTQDKFLLDLSDPEPGDPTVYYLDHDDYTEDPITFGRLSAWLAGIAKTR